MHPPDNEPEPMTDAQAVAFGCSALTSLGCGLMVFVGGLILIAVIVLLVI